MKTFTLLLIFLLSSISFSQGNFTLEWESPLAKSVGTIASMESINSVREIYTNDYTTLNIYDGATHQLKYTYSNIDSSNVYLLHNTYPSSFFDVNNDNILDIISVKQIQSPRSSLVKIINGSNGQIIWQNSYSNYYTYPSIVDVDGDGYLELTLNAYDANGYVKMLILSTPAPTIGLTNNQNTATEFSLGQNYPNPFNPTTSIEYSISKKSQVLIKLYDVLGQEVKTLVDDIKNTGDYKIDFNGSDLSSGTYFYQITLDGLAETKKMVLVK